MEPLKEWNYKGIPVKLYKSSQHCSKNYYEIINSFKNSKIEPIPIDDALEFLLRTKLLPDKERESIRGFTIFLEDKIICLHCTWAPKTFQLRYQVVQEIGWYPYVTGIFLDESKISRETDNWSTKRNFNALEFEDFELDEIKLNNISKGSGTSLMLTFNNFKIILDCCFDIHNSEIWNDQFIPDLLFISHAHKDHFINIEALPNYTDSVPIIMSHITLDLILYYTKNKPAIHQFLTNNAYPLIFDDIYFVNNNISFQILKSGHFPGAAMLYIYTPQHRILYSGDLCLYDLQPIKGGASGIQNLNGPLNTLILDGQFCNDYFPSQKFYLDLACASALKTLQEGSPVLVMGDAGSWLLIFYLKFFYYFLQINKKYRIYLDQHTIEIMKILRSRHEDITASLSQRILRFHDPFASIIRQDLDALDFRNHNKSDPPIILYNSNDYHENPNEFLLKIFENPRALLIITGPIRSPELESLWKTEHYKENFSYKKLKCELFGHKNHHNYPPFCLHPDKAQVLDIIQHLFPPDVYLFHRYESYITSFQRYFMTKMRRRFPKTEIHNLEKIDEFILYKAN